MGVVEKNSIYHVQQSSFLPKVAKFEIQTCNWASKGCLPPKCLLSDLEMSSKLSAKMISDPQIMEIAKVHHGNSNSLIVIIKLTNYSEDKLNNLHSPPIKYSDDQNFRHRSLLLPCYEQNWQPIFNIKPTLPINF